MDLNHAGGNPGQNGDFVPEADIRFTFLEGTTRACQNIFIFNDDLFEVTEDFSLVVSGILLPDGSEVPSVLGVTIQPSQTQVLILDDDG